MEYNENNHNQCGETDTLSSSTKLWRRWKAKKTKTADPQFKKTHTHTQRFHYNLYFSYKFLYPRPKNFPFLLLRLHQHNAGTAREESRRKGWSHHGSIVDNITSYPEQGKPSHEIFTAIKTWLRKMPTERSVAPWIKGASIVLDNCDGDSLPVSWSSTWKLMSSRRQGMLALSPIKVKVTCTQCIHVQKCFFFPTFLAES